MVVQKSLFEGVNLARRGKADTSTIRGVSGKPECHLILESLEETLLTSSVESSRNQLFQCRLVEERPIREFGRRMNALTEPLDSTGYIYNILSK